MLKISLFPLIIVHKIKRTLYVLSSMAKVFLIKKIKFWLNKIPKMKAIEADKVKL